MLFRSYYTGDWERAIVIAEEAIADKSTLTPYYEKMLERLKDGKPIDWDGVYRATSK